jgi:SAM-dependent methyltransferase
LIRNGKPLPAESVENDGLSPRGCKVCDGHRIRLYCRKASAAYYACDDCLSIFQSCSPRKESMVSYTEAEYEIGVYRDYVKARAMKLDHFRRRMRRINSTLSGNSGRLLDIGCACGYFLEVAAECGYDVQGVEFSTQAIKSVREELRPKILHVDVETLSHANAEAYDLVTGFDLIEHLNNPLKFLEQVRGLLKPGGSIAISIPDTSHFLRWWMRSFWPHLAPMQHLCLFSAKSLRIALERTGFEVLLLEPARKTVSIDYLMEQIRIHNPLAYATYKCVRPILPRKTIEKYRRPNIGEIFAIARI